MTAINMTLAAKKLPAETLIELEEFLGSDAIQPHYAVWVKTVLDESKVIATNNIQRLLWHHSHGRALRGDKDDLQFIVGLMQTDSHWGDKTTLTREQETAFILLEQALSEGSGAGVSFSNNYGSALQGTRLLYAGLGDYVLANAERIDDVCDLIRKRDIRDVRSIKSLLHVSPWVEFSSP